MTMTHWAERYIGMPYIPKIGDCASLAERVAREVLGIDPGLPVSHETSLRAQADQINQFRAAYIERVAEPIDAHPVQFVARGRFFHFGVVCHRDGQVLVLHNDQSAGMVICQRLSDMTRWAYKFDGFYRWLATT